MCCVKEEETKKVESPSSKYLKIHRVEARLHWWSQVVVSGKRSGIIRIPQKIIFHLNLLTCTLRNSHGSGHLLSIATLRIHTLQPTFK